MAEPRPTTQQNHVDGVLQDYLDQLLITATTPAVASPESAPARQHEVMETTVRQETVTAIRPAAVVVPVALKTALKIPDIPVAPDVVVPDVIAQDVDVPDVVVAVEPESEVVEEAAPVLDWRSSQGIECLIFKVAGLKLAIPLPLLGGVYPVTDKVTPLFGQAAWSLGIWQGDDSKLTIIDSAQLIMPERGVQLREAGYQFFIQLDRSPWALACQEICDTVTLVYDSIKWRGEGSKRPWLAGTVIAEMCALLDVPGIMLLLEQQRRPEVRSRH